MKLQNHDLNKSIELGTQANLNEEIYSNFSKQRITGIS